MDMFLFKFFIFSALAFLLTGCGGSSSPDTLSNETSDFSITLSPDWPDTLEESSTYIFAVNANSSVSLEGMSGSGEAQLNNGTLTILTGDITAKEAPLNVTLVVDGKANTFRTRLHNTSRRHKIQQLDLAYRTGKREVIAPSPQAVYVRYLEQQYLIGDITRNNLTAQAQTAYVVMTQALAEFELTLDFLAQPKGDEFQVDQVIAQHASHKTLLIERINDATPAFQASIGLPTFKLLVDTQIPLAIFYGNSQFGELTQGVFDFSDNYAFMHYLLPSLGKHCAIVNV
jgi:hypothetical protein